MALGCARGRSGPRLCALGNRRGYPGGCGRLPFSRWGFGGSCRRLRRGEEGGRVLSMGWCDVKFVRQRGAVGMFVGSVCWCARCEVRDLASGACSVEFRADFLVSLCMHAGSTCSLSIARMHIGWRLHVPAWNPLTTRRTHIDITALVE